MGFFSRSNKSEKKFSSEEILTHLPGRWAGPGKIYTPAGVQNYRVELALEEVRAVGSASLTTSREPPLQISGKMISFFDSGNNLETDVHLKLEKEVWSLNYAQTNVHGQGKLTAGKLEFLQKDPSGKSGGQTIEIWSFLSANHLFIENFILGPTGEKEPFLKILLQKS